MITQEEIKYWDKYDTRTLQEKKDVTIIKAIILMIVIGVSSIIGLLLTIGFCVTQNGIVVFCL